MSIPDYAAMSSERLLELFVESAKAAGTVVSDMSGAMRSGLSEKLRQTPERGALVARIRALGVALCARKPIAQIRRLFEDDDPDVRAWAGGQFVGVDPEWATAAISGVLKKLPTREVLAMRDRARQEPPSRPTLPEMSDDTLLDRFENAAQRMSGTRFLDAVDNPEDQETINRLIGEGTDILREVKSRRLLERLVPFLDSSDDRVRVRAAQGCLRIAEAQAVAALEAVAAKRNFDASISAQETLLYWRKGKCLVDGL
jgi:HEAT repeat protein